jgi:hypothetical protein
MMKKPETLPNHSSPTSGQGSEAGQSLVELALSFMLIVLILAGAIDLGRAFFAVIALRDAAQEGVIYASINPDDVSGIERRVQDTSDSPIDMDNIPASDIDISWNINGTTCVEGQVSSPCDAKCAGFYDNAGTTESNWVEVQVEFDFQFSMPIIPEFFPGGQLRLRVADTHTILAPQCP